ncbi:Hypothetical protein, putative [Bodo saltans]|uniref:Uncharacterized protein n=1 Tax=Bodo saltans TaxID=75058 RepID=A0A0S4JQS2_BODSA|nr:Hypothetical protein, putative [Bodo saltans]|eukprot:CUG91659.1 Hypothetical protein, putative [Bodo saltans]
MRHSSLSIFSRFSQCVVFPTTCTSRHCLECSCLLHLRGTASNARVFSTILRHNVALTSSVSFAGAVSLQQRMSSSTITAKDTTTDDDVVIEPVPKKADEYRERMKPNQTDIVRCAVRR